ncbi:MAG TPA: 3-hydroxyacyl-CoA dehydrogenase family protein, partial [Polyangiaceae bacterium]
ERVLSEGRPLRRASALTAQLDDPNLLLEVERAVARRQRGFLAPLRCVEAVRAAVELPFTKGLRRERELFVELMMSPESKAQRHVFFAEREVAKVPDLPPDTPARPVKSAALVGSAGAAELTACFASAGIALVRYATQDDFEELRGVDLLIEAEREDVTAKRELIARLDAIAGPTTIVASSASFVGLDSLVSATSRPQNLVGMHFADSADGAKLLENVRGRETASDVYATVMRLGKTLGKVAVPVRGLLSARSFAQYLREAFVLVEEGASPEQVDSALQAFGFPAGPFAVLDRVGLDVVLQGRNGLFDALSPRVSAMELLSLMAAHGRLGRRAAAGFYRYSGEESAPDPEISEWIVQQSEQRGITRRNIADEEICERCWFVVVNDAARALDEGIAARPLDVDLIWIHGLGYPSYRGGPLFHSDQMGLRAVLDGIRRYGRRTEQEGWVPAPLLERLVEREQGFYSRS